MHTETFILRNSKEKLIRFYDFYINLYYTYHDPLKLMNRLQIAMGENKKYGKDINDNLNIYYDKLIDSFDFLRDLTILLTVRIEKFIQEYQMLLNRSVQNCMGLNKMLDILLKNKTICEDIIIIKKYVLISNYSKHGYGKSMKKIIDEKISLTWFAERYYTDKNFIYSDDKRIVIVDIQDIELYYKAILNVIDYLINTINSK